MYYLYQYKNYKNFNSDWFQLLLKIEFPDISNLILRITEQQPGIINSNSRFLLQLANNEYKVDSFESTAFYHAVKGGWNVNFFSPIFKSLAHTI